MAAKFIMRYDVPPLFQNRLQDLEKLWYRFQTQLKGLVEGRDAKDKRK